MTEGSGSTGRTKRVVALAFVAFAIGSVSFAFFKKEDASSATKAAVAETPVATLVQSSDKQESAKQDFANVEPAQQHILARYLHGSARCVSCKTIEAYATEAIESEFSKELADGKLVWTSVDIEAGGFRNLIQEFQLSSQSIVLTDEGAKSPKKWKKLDKIWELLNNKPAFLQYVKSEIRAYMGGR